MSHTDAYFQETRSIATDIDSDKIERLVSQLYALRARKGRLWLAGLGGSAANASHAANDFRKLCNIEAYSLSDNVSELTALANDLGWSYALSHQFWRNDDVLFVLSVGGGSEDVSRPLVTAITNAKFLGMVILGIVGRDGGHTAKHGDCVVIVPTVEASRVTPHTEGWQSVILHCIVSHPDLQRVPTKW